MSGSPLDREIAVLTGQGISPALASEALDIQRKVAQTALVSKVEAALGSGFAGVWFEPTAARFHIGVTSGADRERAMRAVARAGLTAGVTVTPVRSTWAALLAAQKQWNERLGELLSSREAATGLDAQRNAVSIEISSSVPARERCALKDEAAVAVVNVLVHVAPPSRFRVEPSAAKTSA